MDANLSELMMALPEDQEADARQEQIQELIADLAMRRVPVSSLHRLWIVGELSADVALAYFALWVRRYFVDAGAQQRQTMETNLRLALKMFHRLAYMRGAMTKIGQAAGNFPHVLPGQIAEMLEKLHFDAPPMHYAIIREVFQNELGKYPEELFQSFEKEAFAAASIGQVHRARLKSGEEVAVKIQYPGVARTIDADFRNLSALLFPMRLSQDWEAIRGYFDEIHRMLRQEVDYAQEARSLSEAREIFDGTASVVVPRVFPEYSTKRVLTMEFIPGMHLPEFLATNPSQELRDQFGTAMYAAWQKLYSAHMNYADPSAGNYVFMADGRLGLLDFGCVQHYTAEERELNRLGERFHAGAGEVTLAEFLKRAAWASDAEIANPEYMELMGAAVDWLREPASHHGPFDFGDEGHLQRGIDCYAALARRRSTRSHPMYLYFCRTVFGMRAVLYRLRARVDARWIFANVK